MNITKDRKLIPFRISKENHEKLKLKSKSEGLDCQKVFDVLISLYLKDNKEVMKHINHRYEERKNKKGALDSSEREQLFNLIEREHSPLKDMEQIVKELKDNDEI